MKKIAAVLCVIFSLALVAVAQQRPTRAARTVTNAELEKHKQKRLIAEREYRQNYDQMGFPSPEELEEQRKEDQEARLALARQLREARLEETRIKLEKERVALEAARLEAEREAAAAAAEYSDGRTAVVYGGYYGFPATGLFGAGGFKHRKRFGRGGFMNIPLYRATPVGVFPAGVFRPGSFGGSRIRFGGGRRHR